jgi:hypothetical protein
MERVLLAAVGMTDRDLMQWHIDEIRPETKRFWFPAPPPIPGLWAAQ